MQAFEVIQRLGWREFPEPVDRCLVWPNKTIQIKVSGRNMQVHRFLIFCQTLDEVPTAPMKRTCGTPNCVNPQHWCLHEKS